MPWLQDNTLTEPYAELVAPQLASALEQCKRTFPDRVVLFSNSAGLQEFDPDGVHSWRPVAVSVQSDTRRCLAYRALATAVAAILSPHVQYGG